MAALAEWEGATTEEHIGFEVLTALCFPHPGECLCGCLYCSNELTSSIDFVIFVLHKKRTFEENEEIEMRSGEALRDEKWIVWDRDWQDGMQSWKEIWGGETGG